MTKRFTNDMSVDEIMYEAFELWIDEIAVAGVRDITDVYNEGKCNMIISNLIENFVNSKLTYQDYRKRVLSGRMATDDCLYTISRGDYESYKSVFYDCVVKLFIHK